MFRPARAVAAGDVFGRALAEAQERMVVEVWPENWPAFHLFARLRTQWRVGVNGPTGLDYNVALRFLDRMQLEPDEYDELLEHVAVMEQQALASMRETD